MKRRTRKSLEKDARLLAEAVPIMRAALDQLVVYETTQRALTAELERAEASEIALRRAILAAMGSPVKFDWDTIPAPGEDDADAAVEAEYRSY